MLFLPSASACLLTEPDQLIIDNLISLSYSMPVFSANLFGLFYLHFSYFVIGSKGYSGITGMPSNGYVWYINGYVASELYMRRGLTYAFRVEGGDDPYNPDFYNPLVISTDPVGGFERLSKEKENRIRVLAGMEYTRRGVPRPTASGKQKTQLFVCLGPNHLLQLGQISVKTYYI